MRKLMIVAFIVITMLGFTSCQQQKKLFIKARSAQVGHEAEKLLDGDVTTGWISQKHIEANASEVIDIDFGEVKNISKIIIDDSFEQGYTNEIDPYDKANILIEEWDCTTWEGNDTPERAFDHQLGRKGWRADIIPTSDAPVYMTIKLTEPIKLGKLVLNNQGYGTVPTHFEIKASSDGETYTTLYKKDANTLDKLACVVETEEAYSYLQYLVYDQSGETVTLDEMTLYTKNEDKVYDHYPRKFSVLTSTDDSDYEVILMENANTQSIKTITFEPRDVRYIKYVVMEELGNNKPSLGEIIVE